MRRNEAYAYRDRAVAYLHGRRHAFRVAARSTAATRRADDDVHIAIAIEGDDDDRRIAVRVRELDEPTLAAVAMMRALGHLPDDAPVERVGLIIGLSAAAGPCSPIQPGIACANRGGPPGTLGCLVTIGGGTFILSANHVLALEDHAFRKEIMQPQRGVSGERQIGTLESAVPLQPFGNQMDAAVARVTVNDVDPTIFNGVTIIGIRTTPLAAGDSLFKFGQATEEKTGTYLSMASNVPVQMPSGNSFTFDDQIEVDSPGDPFSNGGDSGALVYDNQHRAVGILFGGNTTNRSYVTPIDRILTKFGAALL